MSLLLFAMTTGVHALSVTAPNSVSEGEPIHVTLSGVGSLAILIDGLEVASGTGTIEHTLPTDGSSSGTYAYTFTSSHEGNTTKQIQVTNTPLTMTVTAPSSEATTSPVTFTSTTNWDSTCSVTVDSTTYPLSDGTTHTTTQSISEGVHTLMYSCILGSESLFAERTLLVDTQPPRITTSGPGGTQTGPYITLSVDTNEIAQCRYGAQDAPFASLPGIMSSQYVLRNTVTLTLPQPASYTYFVRCRDVHGHTTEIPTIISFLNRVPPTATIELEENEEVPLPPGTYEIRLTTNVLLTETPKLSYRLDPSATSKNVGLTGDDNEWTGYFTVPENTEDGVLTFSFEGKSLEGTVGKEITSGGVIAIDGKAPDQISEVVVTNRSGYIRLSWTMKKEEDYTYNIYRSTSEGVTEDDMYRSIGSTSFTDLDVTSARYYYYRVAAVDDAGNIGPLSREVWGSSEGETESLGVEPQNRRKIEDEITRLTTALIDANKSITTLEQERDTTARQIILDMEYATIAREARFQLEESLRALRTLLTGNPTTVEVDVAIEQSESLRQRSKVHFIKRITPQSQIDVNQPVDLDSIAHNLPYALTNKKLSERDQLAYLTSSQALNERLSVRVRATSFTVWDVVGSERKYTFVEKTVMLDEPGNDISIIEVIPKEVADQVEKISFSEEPFVLEDDPVVQYTFPVLEEETFNYVVPGWINLEDVKRSRTLAYPTSEINVPSGNLVTGKATTETALIFSWDMILILIGVLVVIGLVVYYVSISTTPEPFNGLPAAFTPRPVAVQTTKRAPRRRIVSRPIAKKDPHVRIEEAEALIDKKLYEPALAAYRDVLTTMKDDHTLNLTVEVKRVYQKLLLHKHLDAAHDAISQADIEKARKSLTEAKTAAQEIGEEDTPLIHDAKTAFQDCVRGINKLEIERIDY